MIQQDASLDDDIDMDMADEYDIGTYFSKVFRIDGGLGVIDFSMLRLKENHETKPLWVCPNFRIFLDVSSRLYEKVSIYVCCYGQATDFLTAIAEPLSRPQFIHEYRITDSSLYGAVSVGLETDLIINRLEQIGTNN